MGGWTRDLAGRTKQRKLLAVRMSNKMGAIVGRKEEQLQMNLFNPKENKETSLSWLKCHLAAAYLQILKCLLTFDATLPLLYTPDGRCNISLLKQIPDIFVSPSFSLTSVQYLFTSLFEDSWQIGAVPSPLFFRGFMRSLQIPKTEEPVLPTTRRLSLPHSP
ncbi:hypothetical protein BLNAU_17041 [Blattamonas nauphoetae]|uniref:Uncharacterized protein n=1 Tax=Blattamonas nauphoetae TaxID=2049346 RepID=A0ABQ9X9L3_9EUKA|nr:hypothetical protein BLNAU_17041 [Blattamonas nauphoetae]